MKCEKCKSNAIAIAYKTEERNRYHCLSCDHVWIETRREVIKHHIIEIIMLLIGISVLSAMIYFRIK